MSKATVYRSISEVLSQYTRYRGHVLRFLEKHTEWPPSPILWYNARKMLSGIFNPSWYLIYGGLLLILAELFVGIATGFDMVLIGTTLILGGGVGNFTGNWQIGLFVTFVLAILYVIFGRSYVKKRLTTDHQPSNVAALIGKSGVVTEKITPQTAGRVKIRNEEWRAEADQEIDKNTTVKVKSFHGVTARVVESN